MRRDSLLKCMEKHKAIESPWKWVCEPVHTLIEDKDSFLTVQKKNILK